MSSKDGTEVITVDELIESLTKSLGDDKLKARGGVIRKPGEISDVKAIEPLITALRAQDKNVRQRAVKELVRIGGCERTHRSTDPIAWRR
ncbi:MAG: HEAT repeat domain-containing protein [Methanosarcinales archaeon]|nr:MAG: HEAT repeat domain-containing protein [Methanosarcinales archaeon]